MGTLNDDVYVWGDDNRGYDHFNPSKDDLTIGYDQKQVSEYQNAGNYNEGLIQLAATLLAVIDLLLLESGDFMLAENGDRLVLG